MRVNNFGTKIRRFILVLNNLKKELLIFIQVQNFAHH